MVIYHHREYSIQGSEKKQVISFIGVFQPILKTKLVKVDPFPTKLGTQQEKFENHELNSCPRHTITPFERDINEPLKAIS